VANRLPSNAGEGGKTYTEDIGWSKVDNYQPTDEKPASASPVQCHKCTRWSRAWRFGVVFWMWVEKTLQGVPAEGEQYFGKFGNLTTDGPAYEKKYHYECYKCHAASEGISEAAAMAIILNQRSEKVRKESYKYKEARLYVQTEFQMVGSRSKMRKVQLLSMTVLFSPWAHLLKVAIRLEDRLHELVLKHANLINPWRGCESDEQMEVIVKQVRANEADMEAANKPAAFSSHGDEMQNRFLVSATYADAWVSVGKHTYFRSWYICDLEGCGAVITSKGWKRRHADVWAKKKGWYCSVCGRGYKHSFGQLVDMLIDGVPTWALADVPPEKLENIRAAHLEEIFSSIPDLTPEKLYRNLKSYRPITGELLAPCA
jgi:hypothetical protein